ncbi:MAG: hypothetical protein ACXVYL_16865 [Oryzihumus sp.]
MKPLVAALALGTALTLAGCGSESSPVSSASPSTGVQPSASPASAQSPSAAAVPDGPACADVWTVGGKLPGGYDGCVKAGTWVKGDPRHCEFGRDLFVYADAFYAVTGGNIMRPGSPLLEQKKYRMVLRACSG